MKHQNSTALLCPSLAFPPKPQLFRHKESKKQSPFLLITSTGIQYI